MTKNELLKRISCNSDICGAKPCIRGTRIQVSIILDALAEGLAPEQIIAHYPALSPDDVRAAAAYAAELVREELWSAAEA